MEIYEDQIGRKISIPKPPKRIISLVPSQTEFLHYLGLDNEVLGITKFCIHPNNWFQTKTRVGGTKQLKMETIASLKPDLIIANKEENDQSQLECLFSNYPVWVSDIKNEEDAFSMMQSLGTICSKEKEASKLVGAIKALSEIPIQAERLKAAYFIWQKPYMLAGSDTFIHHMMSRAGLENVITQGRYPESSLEALKELQPDLLLLSSEPFPFKAVHQEEIQNEFPKAKVLLVDGELFSWYGSRMLKAFPYLRSLRNQV